MTLFQSLAFAAGFDPVKGPGSSCSAADASGQCVVPWAGGTKAVSSVVLIANGVCFAVCNSLLITLLSLTTLKDNDHDIHDDWFCCRLWLFRTLAAFHLDGHMLDCTVCKYDSHKCVSTVLYP
jgi:hypothetical protein